MKSPSVNVNSKPTFGQLRLGDVADLPDELKAQIKISDSDQLEMDVIEVIRSLDGEAAIDEILVGLWRKTNKVHERDFLARKLYRMTQGNLIYSAKRKGYYQIEPLSDDEQSAQRAEDKERSISDMLE